MPAMSEWIPAIIGVVVGLVLGGIGAAIWFINKASAARIDLGEAQARMEILQEEMQRQSLEIDRARQENADLDDRRETAERNAAELNVKLEEKQTQFDQQQKLLADAESRLGDAFAALGAKALQTNSQEFLKLAATAFEKLIAEAKGDAEKRQQAIGSLIKPITELLDKQTRELTEMEKKREGAYRGIEEQIKQIIQTNEKLDREANRLVAALRRPEQRGRWGEMQLRNVVELAGMTEHCDFHQQVQTDDPSTRDRPDMTVHMPGGGVIVVDSKVALDAYLDAIQPDADRDAQFRRHAEQVVKHYKGLAGKRYWDQFERTPQLVVMFMPIESALVAALEVKPDLHADAMQNHVLIATPTLLVAVLRAVAYGWQQEDVAANAREISQVGRELYDRLAKFVSYFEGVGKGLKSASGAYDKAVGSLESRILPSSRKLKELHATTKAEIESPGRLEIELRPVTAEELKPLPEGGESV